MDDEEDYSKLSLTERWTHSKWNVRQGAYKEAAEAFAKSDASLAPFASDPSLLKSAATDANVNALDSGVRAVAAFLAYADLVVCSKVTAEVLRPMAEKGLGAVKPAVKAATVETILAFVESSSDPSATVTELTELTAHKLPKVIAASIASLTAIYTQFGTQAVDPKPALAVLPKLFAHTDRTVRAEAVKLSLALSCYIGAPAISAVLCDIKPVQLKELQEQFASAPALSPTRTLRIKASSGAADSSMHDEVVEESEPVEIDPYDLAPTVNVMAKIPVTYERMMTSSKWKERKEMLDEIVNILNVPKMNTESDYMNLVRTLLPIIAKDANIMCATQAMIAIMHLSNGLRSSFGRYASRDLLQAIVDRFKEKKVTVLEAASGALHALVQSLSLTDVFDTVVGNFSSKVPQIKIECTKFVASELAQAKEIPPHAVIQEVVAAGIKLMNDTQESVRRQSAILLGTIMKMVGERALASALQSLDDIRMAKVREAYESAVVSVKPTVPTTKAAPAASSARSAARPMAAPPRRREAPSAPPAASPPKPPAATPVKKSGARTVHGAEFTPARQPPAARRRMVSPIKPPAERPIARPSRLTAPQEAHPDMDFDSDIEELQRTIRRLEDQCESYKVRLEAEQSRREAVDAENQALREQLNAARQSQNDMESVSVRMNSMSLDSRRISALRPLSRSSSGGAGGNGEEPHHRSHSRLVPIAPPSDPPKTPARSPRMSMPAQMESSPVSQENWRRAAEVTSELKRRIEAMKRQRGTA
ncbi:Spindle pole body component alp14 [Wickerhamiella sorbophila]|uniref:Spindle pole body component alp14 n=1 Tax=Wickerhamiella sorbophila TaxID=45607 RepID=A0A2T0FH85_9ASCO|nr:Spindle pole body component alp14 [Wickerhamiella sorbophila]PRT54340.1 Spindle pole body component alp14 [Wickerhamiella sorbophila]